MFTAENKIRKIEGRHHLSLIKKEKWFNTFQQFKTMIDGVHLAWFAPDGEEYAAPPYNCRCHSICKSSCDCAECLKLFRACTDVEEAVKEVFEGKILVETLLQSQSDLKTGDVLCDLYLTSSWGWRGVIDEPFVVLETVYETLDRLDMQFADHHFESDIDSAAYNRYYYSPSFFDIDMSSWDQLDRDSCCTWWHVSFGLFSNSIWRIILKY